MKQQFIKKNNSRSLLLFFAGWGMDTTPFLSTFHTTSDICICYDYTSLDFDAEILAPYDDISVVAWSFGVWVAAHTLQNRAMPITQSVALNGTCHPIDDAKGIPTAIFEGTLRTLSARSIEKFNRRMCGSLTPFFNEHKPQRSVESLRDELSAMQTHVMHHPTPAYVFHSALIGQHDLIFPAQNQARAWENTPTKVCHTEDAHFLTSFATGYA